MAASGWRGCAGGRGPGETTRLEQDAPLEGDTGTAMRLAQGGGDGELVNPWTALPMAPPYVLPGD